MRGKVADVERWTLNRRITPAYAGKSQTTSLTRSTSRDHPRLCGEKRKLSRLLIFSLGSPPPMRGKGIRTAPTLYQAGITPAYAGKSYGITEVYDNKKGSPPPMRGKG